MICMNLAIDSEMAMNLCKTRGMRKRAGIGSALLALFVMPSAHASMFTGETLDAVANGMAWFVLIVMPGVGIAIFWIVHVLPEKIAEKRHHPNKDAIHVLCLLSLVFGGMLWPFAWLWAYTRPVVHKMAYGTEKHEDYFVEQGELAASGELEAGHIDQLRAELEYIKARGKLTPELRRVYERLQEARPSPNAAGTGGAG
jgi:CBS domain containing-hemolysin-like protein